MKILLLYGDANQALPIAKSMSKARHTIDAICASKWSYGYGSRYIRKKYLHENAEDVDEYFSYLIQLLKKEKYDTILPMRDSTAEVMCKYRDELLKYTQFVMPDYETFERGFDKHKLMEVCQRQGYPHPETYILNDKQLENLDLDGLRYPLLIKPNHTFGARGMTLCNNKEELIEKYPKVYKEYGSCHLQTFIPEGGHQVEFQLYVNEKKELVQSSVIKKFRWYPEKGGSSCCNVSWQHKKMVDICYRLLLDIGWVGFADFDTIEDPRTGELLIMELNPRVPACVKTPFAAGIDWADVIVNEYLQKEHKRYTPNREVYLRHLGFESLWFIHSENKWKTKPNWFKLIGRSIYYQDMSDWTDPMPFFRGSWGNIKKMMNPEFRKSKEGTR